MLKGDESFIDSVLFAFGLEKGSSIFYSRAAGKMDDKKSKEVFSAMAEVEEGHMANLRLLYCGMENEACPVSLEELTESVPGPYVEGGRLLDEAMKDLNVAFLDDVDALKIAVKHEAEAYSFYRKAAKRMEDPMVRVLFENLAAEEQKHVEQLSAMLKEKTG